MAFKMKHGGSAFPYGNSPLKDAQNKVHTHPEKKEEELATEDKLWEDLTEEEKIARKNTMQMLKEYNLSEQEKKNQ